jgi:class 3 adenylate cyclase
VQEIHDAVIRKHLTFHAGYEINTQGDAFEIAFHSVEAAICFCLKVQQELLDIKWQREALALPTAARVMDHSGRPIFAGPRVRMGIHVAKRGTFSRRMNPHTGHVQFSGPAYSLAEEVGDCAFGGQVVMTGVAYEVASRAGAITPGLCVFNHLGMFDMRNAQEATSVFEVPPCPSSRPALLVRMPFYHPS